MRRNLSILFLLLAGLALWASMRETGDVPGNWIRLEIPDERTTLSWQRAGDRFVSKQSKVVLSVEQVAQMRLELRRTSRGREHFAQEVGITPEALRTHRDQILKSCYIEKLPPELEHHLDYQAVAKNAQALAFLDDLDWVGQGVTLVLDGRPELRVKARSTIFSFLLPATVDCAGQHWETCSLAVPYAFASLFEPGSRHYDSLAGVGGFWSQDIWNHDDSAFGVSIWGDLVSDYQTVSNLPGFRKRPGYEQLNQAFQVESLWDAKEGFCVTLAPHQLGALDLVAWSNEQNASVASILPTYQKCAAEIPSHHPWLLEWKKSGTDRALRLNAEIPVPDDSIFTQWHQAGLPGKPEFELELLEHNRHCATVWLSSSSPKSLIPWATSRWHDGITVNSPRETGQLLIANASGKLERK